VLKSQRIQSCVGTSNCPVYCLVIHPLFLVTISPNTFYLNQTTGLGGILLDSGGAFTYLNPIAHTGVSQVSVIFLNKKLYLDFSFVFSAPLLA